MSKLVQLSPTQWINPREIEAVYMVPATDLYAAVRVITHKGELYFPFESGDEEAMQMLNDVVALVNSTVLEGM